MKTAMRNPMQDKIARGEAVFGASVMFPSPQIVELLAYAGFDWVLIDCEHGSIGLADVEVMAAITSTTTCPASSAPVLPSSSREGVVRRRAEHARQPVHANLFTPTCSRQLVHDSR